MVFLATAQHVEVQESTSRLPAYGQHNENIAKGRKYTLVLSPNYQHCIDPGDGTQLTDGIHTEGYFWTQKSTVGWSAAHPVIITVDLESVQPISGVSFNTAAGVAGVQWEDIYIRRGSCRALSRT